MTGLREAAEQLSAAGKRLIVPGEWSKGRIAGEAVLAVALAFLAGGAEDLTGSGPPRAIGAAVFVLVLSPLRRVLPAVVLILSGAVGGLLTGMLPLFMIAGWSAGRRIEGLWRPLAAFGAAFALAVGVTVYSETPEMSPIAGLVFAAVLFVATTGVPGIAGRYWTQRRTLLRTLRQHNAQLLRERAMVAGQARLRERQRIAQDMHDSLGHQLALIAVHTGALEVDRGLTGQQREAVGVLRQASVSAMHELREVVGILRDGVEGPEGEAGGDGRGAATALEDGGQPPQPPSAAPGARRGVAGIEGLVEASRGAGAAVELVGSGTARALPPAADHAAYRIAQEGLTNALKHAPGAPLTVGLRYEPDSLVVEVANGPVPVPEPVGGPGGTAGAGGRAGAAAGWNVVVSGGQGLTGLRERARLIGGMVHAGPTPDGGFRVAGVLPYEQAGAAGRKTGAVVAGYGDGGAAAVGSGGAGVDPYARPGSVEPYGSYGPYGGVDGLRPRGRLGGPVVGCGAVLLALVIVGVMLVWGGVALVGEADEAMVEPKVYDSVKVGQPEAEVRAKLPSGDSFLTDGLDEKGPARPEGANCLTLMSTEEAGDWDEEPVYRFCFRGGELIEKRTFEVKM